MPKGWPRQKLEGGKGLKLECAGPGVHPPVQSSLLWGMESGMGREEEQTVC